jgi:hypothetical protein
MSEAGNSDKRAPDWSSIEREYRAGIRTLRAIAEEHGITHGAINKRAKAEGWPRDLTAKIKAAAQDKVSKALVSKSVSKDDLVTERQVVEANAEVVAQADLLNRKDVLLAMTVSRSQLEEVAELGEPDFRARLEWLGEVMDTSTEKRQDKANELYRYIIGLAGRVKLSKEIAAAHGVYIPMQRKILKLDVEGDRNQSNLDALLAKINAATD